MIIFPDEEERIREVSVVLEGRFDLGKRLLSFWLNRPFDELLNRSKLSGFVIDTVMMINVAAYRRYRSIIELCQRCEAEDAGILARSLFEVAVATVFILKPQVWIATRRTRRGYIAEPVERHERRKGHGYLTREFRAHLFLASQIFQEELSAGELAKLRGWKRAARTIQKNLPFELMAEAERLIGQEWTYVLKHPPKTYSGLTLKQLSQILQHKFDVWYATIYAVQSKAVHCRNAVNYIDERKRKLYSSISEVDQVMLSANGIFLVCLSALADWVGLGTITASALSAFRREHSE